MPKQVLRGKEARIALMRGVDFLADAVKVTLGPKGRLVCMSQRGIGQSPKVSKDGVTVSRNIDPTDPFEQLGSDLVREAAEKTVEHAGDGTTTSIVLAQALVHAGMEQLENGVSAAEIEAYLKQVVPEITAQLDSMAIPADGERLAQVATISANGDVEIGKLVHAAIQAVGKDGVMSCEESRSLDTTLDVVSGLQIRQGYRSPYFMNDPQRLECAFENPLIFLWEGKVETPKSLIPVCRISVEMGRPLLIIAGDYDPMALAFLAGNNNKSGLRVCAVRADGWGPRRTEILRDIAVLTGGMAITEDLGMKLESVTELQLGKARRSVTTEYRTTIIEGEGSAEQIQVRVDEIRRLIEQTEAPDVQNLLRARLAGLVGGIALIKVGGVTEAEMREKKDRVEDALFATKAAAEEGIVIGGGSALQIAAIRAIASDSIGIDMSMFTNCCLAPKRQIAENAGVPPLSLTQGNLNIGMDMATGKQGDMFEMGVIDPLLVVKEALVNAASVAITILKTETLIIDAEPAK